MNDLTTLGCKVTPTGLKIVGKLTEERWKDIMRALALMEKCMMWVIGDAIIAGEDEGYLPRGKLQEACATFGMAYQTAANAAWVCRTFTSSNRLEHLTYKHHQVAAGHPEALELLAWAERKKATTQQLRAEKQRRMKYPKSAGASGESGL